MHWWATHIFGAHMLLFTKFVTLLETLWKLRYATAPWLPMHPFIYCYIKLKRRAGLSKLFHKSIDNFAMCYSMRWYHCHGPPWQQTRRGGAFNVTGWQPAFRKFPRPNIVYTALSELSRDLSWNRPALWSAMCLCMIRPMGAYCYTILKERYTRLPQSEISTFDNQNHLNRFENLSAWKQKENDSLSHTARRTAFQGLVSAGYVKCYTK